MGRIKRYVAYWTEGIVGTIGGLIIVLPLVWSLYWVENTALGAMTASFCCFLFVSVAAVMRPRDEIEHLNDYVETLSEEE